MIERIVPVSSEHKINFLHLVQSLGVGGAEILLIHYIRALGTVDYNHYVYCFGKPGPIKDKIEELGVPVWFGPQRGIIKNPFRFLFRLILLISDLKKFIKEKKIQIIQSHLGHANQLGVFAGKLAGVQIFPTIHNTMAFETRRGKLDLRVHLIKLVDTIVYRIADHVIAVSQEIKDILKKKFKLNDSKVSILKNGIVIENPDSGLIEDTIQDPADSDQLKIIGVGSLTYQKAFEILIKAVAELIQNEFKGLSVQIAGDGSERLNLENLIQQLGIGDYVKLLGIQDDVMGLLRSSDIFIMPSRYEGLSIAMIEAMACGLPIIASDAPGLRDYIEDGKNGLLFPAEDHQALSQCIIRLNKDKNLLNHLSYVARKSFEAKYDMRKNIKSLNLLVAQKLHIQPRKGASVTNG